MTQRLSPAVFLDRDGVLNRNVFYPEPGEWEAPRSAADFEVVPGMAQALRSLQDAGFKLFLVSNQPNMAKGKAQRADHDAIHAKLMQHLDAAHIRLEDVFYCFHHPKGIVPELSGPCDCRKPSPYFLLKAKTEHGLDLARSWMIGDRDTDIATGRAAGTATIQISDLPVESLPEHPDHAAPTIVSAAQIILSAGQE
jgi:D-glycero-D-manno-heptose 1,7-bisphosphate phosphatase